MPIKRINPVYTHREGEPELGPLDASLFTDIAEVAHDLPYDETYSGLKVDEVLYRKGEVLFCHRPSLKIAYQALGTAIEARSEAMGRPRGTHRFAVHSIRAAQLYPTWHADDVIEDAFCISPDASTVGIRGEIEVEASERVDQALERVSSDGTLLTDGRELVTPEPGMYVAIPRDAPHISPAFDPPRLAIIGNIMPNFLADQIIRNLLAYEHVEETM